MVLHNKEPSRVVVVEQSSEAKASAGASCCCVAPEDASCFVKTTRRTSMAIIVVHVLAFVALGFAVPLQWIASLIGIITGSFLLCVFKKCCYAAAAVFFGVGLAFDLAAAHFWIDLSMRSEDTELGSDVGYFSIGPLLGAITFLIGTVAACMAVSEWQESDARQA